MTIPRKAGIVSTYRAAALPGAALALIVAACSGSDSADFSAGAAGSGGLGRSGGSGAGGTHIGTGGNGGSAGSIGSGGSTGSGGAGGSIGSGGATGSGGAAGSTGSGGGPLPDSGTSDATPSNDAASDTGPVIDAAPDAGCPALVLGGATEDVYVDKGVAQTGNGTAACPFKTILEATNLAAPAGSVKRRTVHVKGNAASPAYDETQAIVLRSRVTLTSDYDGSNPGGVATVRVLARGDCTSFTGALAATFCAIAMENDAVLEKVTVRLPGGAATGNAVLTTSTVPAASAVAPAIVDVNAENAPESGFRIYGSATLGPRVNAMGNRNGVSAGRGTTAAVATIQIKDAPASSGAPSNSFSNNGNNGGGNGVTVFGNYSVSIEGASMVNNLTNGMVIGTPYTVSTVENHHLSNVHMDNNGTSGLRVIGGEVHVMAGASTTNTFNGNKNGYGIDATTGDAIGDVRIILEPRAAPGSGYLVAHQANGNHLSGVHLNRAQPPGPGPNALPHQLASLEARKNGSTSSDAGVFVEIAGASSPNQSSLVLRGSTLLGNSGSGLRFQRGTTNTLDIGTGNSGGYNVFGDVVPGNQNTKSGICYQNMWATPPNQAAELDRWSQSCPLPGGAPAQSNVAIGCGTNGTYVDVTYTGATAPIPSVATCY